MNNMPPILVSTIDRERLYALLDNVQDDSDQVEYLYSELERARFIEPEDMPDDTVTLGCRLKFRNEDSGKEHERVLVLPRELGSHSNAVSILSPVGAALLGLKVGDEIQWPHRGEHLRLRLLAVTQD